MRLLSISGLAISFGGIRALSGVDMEMEENEILAIIGPNGSGKTTLFNCISGVYKPSRGTILFQGRELMGLSPHSIASMGIARTFQNIRLFNHMTVLDNLMLGRHVKIRKSLVQAFLRIRKEELIHREKAEEIIEFLDLHAYRKLRVADCPYGVQKRVEMGRALAMEPLLFLMDEPVAGLTTEERDRIAYLVREIRGRFKLGVIIVEHDLRIISKVSDRMVALNYGLKIAEVTPEEVQRDPGVIRAYVGEG